MNAKNMLKETKLVSGTYIDRILSAKTDNRSEFITAVDKM